MFYGRKVLSPESTLLSSWRRPVPQKEWSLLCPLWKITTWATLSLRQSRGVPTPIIMSGCVRGHSQGSELYTPQTRSKAMKFPVNEHRQNPCYPNSLLRALWFLIKCLIRVPIIKLNPNPKARLESCSVDPSVGLKKLTTQTSAETSLTSQCKAVFNK